MNDDDRLSGLSGVLDRATERIATPHLAATTLRVAGARRARRRAVAGTVVAVVAVVGAASFVATQRDEAPPAPVGSSPATATSAGGIDPSAQRLWDPFTLADAPLAESVLPERLDPPDLPPSVLDHPMDAAVLAWPEEGEDVKLLGANGEWRCIPGTDDAATSTWWYSNPALSSDGSRVALTTEEGVLVVDVTTGDQQVVPWPDDLAPPWDTAPQVRWLPGDAGLAVMSWRDNRAVSLDGEWSEAPFAGYSVAIDPDGAIIEHRWRTSELVEWQDGKVTSRVDFPWQGERFVARHGLVAFTTGSLGDPPRGGPVVADSSTGELVAYAPIRDPHAAYSDNGGLTAQGFLHEDTVLLLVKPDAVAEQRHDLDTWHLVAWHFRTGEFERVTSGADPMGMIDVAPDLVTGD
ncbi:hypothetical protein HNR19_002510 [Nocardioides thalensis]|uniref:WD40 repeat domain-containing protein n=1 Tax=Nocardioides thalensis TaxID=1914755 RepID=A0A853C560_9ACTN|nr:hypothetical protein [Nocardioides thalensis]NYJ01812.1 hypothetical protein [Nocardioides thalensis]